MLSAYEYKLEYRLGKDRGNADRLSRPSLESIPRVLQKKVLRMLHEMHPGMSRMNALARSYVWWPQIWCQQKSDEACVIACPSIEASRSTWQRLHIDHAGPMQ